MTTKPELEKEIQQLKGQITGIMGDIDRLKREKESVQNAMAQADKEAAARLEELQAERREHQNTKNLLTLERNSKKATLVALAVATGHPGPE